MKRELSIATLILAFAACGGGGSSNPGTDAPGVGVDSTPVPTMITISGIASTIDTSGKKPNAGVSIVAKKVSDDSMIATATSGADGTFSISAPTNGAAVDAYLVATKTGLIDTYLYPPGPLSKDFANVPIYQMTTGTQGLANSVGGATSPNDPADGWIGVVVQDATMTAVAGAVLTATPTGDIRYNGTSGLPQSANQAMSTAADGVAYVMNVPAGQVMLGATKTGMTFHSHTINARAAKITLTLVTP